MRYFLDTEFIELGGSNPIQPISIGIVAEDGREYYAITKHFEPSTASKWVKDNVIAHLESPEDFPRKLRKELRTEILDFVGDDANPEFWGYYADYDWVVFAGIFGTMMDLPKGWPMYCRDIKQLCDELGNPKLPEQGKGEHNALADARWNRVAYEFLRADHGLVVKR